MGRCAASLGADTFEKNGASKHTLRFVIAHRRDDAAALSRSATGTGSGGATQRRRLELAAEAPLADLFNYVSALRSLSQGRASFTMRFERYAPALKQQR
jgi:hypothetical protein